MLMSEQDYADIGLPKEPRIKLLKTMRMLRPGTNGSTPSSPHHHMHQQQQHPHHHVHHPGLHHLHNQQQPQHQQHQQHQQQQHHQHHHTEFTNRPPPLLSHQPTLLKRVQAVGPLWAAPPTMDGGGSMVDGHHQMGTHGLVHHHDPRLPPGLHNNVQYQQAPLMVCITL